ncbi:MAG: metallophosphoesterase family protein [Verrucomicrobia bacterium]|nr:metallophosphoesterase family protein [Verrucomicrobiota bacterium]
MKYGIFGDVHSNLEALEAVLADMEDQNVTHPLCIGDLVGYNANPSECLEVVRALGCPVVRGNHDELVTHAQNPVAFSKDAKEALSFSRQQLSPAHLNYLRRLPFTHMEGPLTLVHASLDGPENWAYVSTRLEAQTSFFYQKTNLCFIGHTHRPAVFLKEKEVRPVEFRKVDVHPERLKVARKFLFNVGSVGQPRDGDWRAAYVTYDPHEQIVDLRRVGYEVDKAAAKILKAGLPDSLAKRLFKGE